MTHYAGIIALLVLLTGAGVYAWTRPALPNATLLLLPLAITIAIALWTALISPYSEYGDTWAVVPVLIAFLVVLVWHSVLIVRGPGRGFLAAYGLGHVMFWVPFGLFCLMKISKDSL